MAAIAAKTPGAMSEYGASKPVGPRVPMSRRKRRSVSDVSGSRAPNSQSVRGAELSQVLMSSRVGEEAGMKKASVENRSSWALTSETRNASEARRLLLELAWRRTASRNAWPIDAPGRRNRVQMTGSSSAYDDALSGGARASGLGSYKRVSNPWRTCGTNLFGTHQAFLNPLGCESESGVVGRSLASTTGLEPGPCRLNRAHAVPPTVFAARQRNRRRLGRQDSRQLGIMKRKFEHDSTGVRGGKRPLVEWEPAGHAPDIVGKRRL